MKEPLWLRREWVDALHFQQLKRFGGLYGMRDSGAIDSALARPVNEWVYERAEDLSALAAAYCFGLASNHGYTDGNKRIAFVAMAVFLELNGYALEAAEAEVVELMLSVAAGNRGESELAAWIRQHVEIASGA